MRGVSGIGTRTYKPASTEDDVQSLFGWGDKSMLVGIYLARHRGVYENPAMIVQSSINSASAQSGPTGALINKRGSQTIRCDLITDPWHWCDLRGTQRLFSMQSFAVGNSPLTAQFLYQIPNQP
jgi:hypothetical protein